MNDAEVKRHLLAEAQHWQAKASEHLRNRDNQLRWAQEVEDGGGLPPDQIAAGRINTSSERRRMYADDERAKAFRATARETAFRLAAAKF